MAEHLCTDERTAPDLLIDHQPRGDETVGDCDLLVLNVKDALVRLGPVPIQRAHLILSVDQHIYAERADGVDGMRVHHVLGDDILVMPGELERSMPGIAHEDVAMPRVRSDLQQPVDRHVDLGDVGDVHRVLYTYGRGSVEYAPAGATPRCASSRGRSSAAGPGPVYLRVMPHTIIAMPTLRPPT